MTQQSHLNVCQFGPRFGLGCILGERVHSALASIFAKKWDARRRSINSRMLSLQEYCSQDDFSNPHGATGEADGSGPSTGLIRMSFTVVDNGFGTVYHVQSQQCQ